MHPTTALSRSRAGSKSHKLSLSRSPHRSHSGMGQVVSRFGWTGPMTQCGHLCSKRRPRPWHRSFACCFETARTVKLECPSRLERRLSLRVRLRIRTKRQSEVPHYLAVSFYLHIPLRLSLVLLTQSFHGSTCEDWSVCCGYKARRPLIMPHDRQGCIPRII